MVVIPAHNAGDTLPGLLAALMPQARSAGAQVVVVDSRCTDATPAIARGAGATVVVADRRGASAARNRGVRADTAELIAFLDSDCVPQPHWLERLVTAIEGDPAIGAVGGRVVAAPSEKLLQRHAERRAHVSQETALADRRMAYVLTANCCYRREVLERLGGFNEELRSAEDVDLAWRMQRELGLAPRYVGDAVVEHVHRTTLRGIWRQWVRYGWGSVQLARLYPSKSGWRRRTNLAAWFGRRAGASLHALVMLPLRRAELLDVVSPALEFMEMVAARVGKLQARRAERR
jgi:GT2 family glycosyltransferase